MISRGMTVRRFFFGLTICVLLCFLLYYYSKLSRLVPGYIVQPKGTQSHDGFIRTPYPIKDPGSIKDSISRYQLEMYRDPKCQNVTSDPRSWWRTQFDNDTFSADQDYQRIEQGLWCGSFMMPDYLTTLPQKQEYPFEREYLKDPPITNVSESIDETFSTVELLNKSSSFNLGDRVVFLIHARNGLNRSRSKGGDEIRAWLITDVSQQIKNRVAARIVDLNNGKYLAVAFLPWTGIVKLYVALAYAREYLRAIIFILQTVKGMKTVVGKFENKKASEVTPCYHTPVVPAFSRHEVCNLTSLNGSPWFCGRPLKQSLSCSDHHFSRIVNIPRFLPVTNAEKALLERTNKSPRIRMISSNINFTVTSKSGEERVMPPRTPCHASNRTTTWTHEDPRGYFYKGKFQSFLCTGHQLAMRKCLENKYIVILGDSNARAHYDRMSAIVKCKQMLPRPKEKWHAPLKCVSKDKNTTIIWNPHSQPFLSYRDRWTKDVDLISSTLTLEKLPFDSRRHWVILHHYIHLSFFHISVFEAKYRSLKEAIVQLLVRRPNIRILIRGNHIAWTGFNPHYEGGDHLGRFITHIQKEIFKDLQDKVFFVSLWDFTIATLSSGSHPNYGTQFQQEVFSYLCDE